MKIILQRVRQGRVTIDNEEVGRVDRGYVVLVGVRHGDTDDQARYLAHRTVNLRIFPDEEGRMNRSIQDITGGVLAISQFTLYADTRKGNRPGFSGAAEPGLASKLYDLYVEALRADLGSERVATGRFGAHMVVEIINDGPVTIEINTD